MKAPRRWQIGEVRVTRIVESLGTPPTTASRRNSSSPTLGTHFAEPTGGRIVSHGATWRFATRPAGD